jgi:hypothetical protein
MVDSRDEGTNPIARLKLPPRKRTKNKKHNPNSKISEDPNQLAHNGW